MSIMGVSTSKEQRRYMCFNGGSEYNFENISTHI